MFSCPLKSSFAIINDEPVPLFVRTTSDILNFHSGLMVELYVFATLSIEGGKSLFSNKFFI